MLLCVWGVGWVRGSGLSRAFLGAWHVHVPLAECLWVRETLHTPVCLPTSSARVCAVCRVARLRVTVRGRGSAPKRTSLRATPTPTCSGVVGVSRRWRAEGKSLCVGTPVSVRSRFREGVLCLCVTA